MTKLVTLNINALDMGVVADSVTVVNRYADVNDTHLITANIDIDTPLTEGNASVRVPPSTKGSVYEITFYLARERVTSGFVVMPSVSAYLSALTFYTAYPPYVIGGPDDDSDSLIAWGRIIGDLEEQVDLKAQLDSKADKSEFDQFKALIEQFTRRQDEEITTLRNEVGDALEQLSGVTYRLVTVESDYTLALTDLDGRTV